MSYASNVSAIDLKYAHYLSQINKGCVGFRYLEGTCVVARLLLVGEIKEELGLSSDSGQEASHWLLKREH